MSSRPPLVFKAASEGWEFEQIHRLNYKTFAEEIKQHQQSPSQRLVDKFHSENTYLICLCGRQLAGMLAVRGSRPFSLDQKLENLDTHLPPGRKVCEIRLLAVERKFRGAQVLQGILALLWQHGIEKGYDLAIISGTTRQFKLYQHLGFIPFGPMVGTGDAQFQPMYVTIETFEVSAREFLRSSPSRAFQPSAVNFLPGPVSVRRDVRRAFEQAPESHRGDAFIKDFQSARQSLCELVTARNVVLLLGSGTLANDAIAGQLSLLQRPNLHPLPKGEGRGEGEGSLLQPAFVELAQRERASDKAATRPLPRAEGRGQGENGVRAARGLILTNGEFGERLADHASRMSLGFDLLSLPWGEPFDLAAVRTKIEETKPAWLWCTHCETSTGVLNDLSRLKTLCSEFEVKLCLDCMSTVGVVPVDLSGVYLASCASSKGLRAYPGISMVFFNHELPAALQPLPRYLDLSYYAAQNGVPFTFSSNLLHALHAAIKRVPWQKRFSDLVELSAWLRAELRNLGFNLIGDNAETSPAVVTVALPEELNSVKIGGLIQEAGYLLSYNSEYLRHKNWIQVCMMGDCAKEKVVSLLNALNRVCFRRRLPAQETETQPEPVRS